MLPQPRTGGLAWHAMASACIPHRPLPRITAVSPWMESATERVRCPADAPALPFVPFAVKGTRELHAMIARRRSPGNRPRHRPPLALALVAFLASSGAMIANSTPGEEALTATVPVIRSCANEVQTAISAAAAREHGLCELSFNDATFR